ncbi:MAG: hypothetical protein A2X98_06960 [Deltaproteobacteria bacterium GWC2_66_88]|nr:MAG: hypothetical protein A2X98_06960 [Deltaproteobacteria bacterium GWC2_66_88]
MNCAAFRYASFVNPPARSTTELRRSPFRAEYIPGNCTSPVRATMILCDQSGIWRMTTRSFSFKGRSAPASPRSALSGKTSSVCVLTRSPCGVTSRRMTSASFV